MSVPCVGSTAQQGDGYAFNLKDSAGRRWMTLAYETEAEAKAAWEKIIAATAGVIAAAISP
jgi:hypothetical protein